MKKKLMILSLCMLVILTTACGKNPKLKNGEEVIVKVDGLKITADKLYNNLKVSYGYNEVMNMIDQYIASKEIPDSDKVNEYVNQVYEYYNSYANNYGTDLVTFVNQYMNLTNIKSAEEFKEYIKNQYKVTLAVQKQIGKNYTDEEIEAYYNENYSKILNVKHILIEFDEDEDEYDEAYNTALTIIGKLKETDAKNLNSEFEQLAYDYSADSSYSNGGLIENFMASDVVKEFWDASATLKNGEFTDTPVKSEYGYHIILKVSEKEKPALKDAKDDIRIKLAENAISQDSLLQYTAMNELRKKYNLSFYDTDLEKSYNDFVDQLNK